MATTAATMQGGWRRSNESPVRFSPPSAMVRAEQIREYAARTCTLAFPPRKKFRPLLSAQKLSQMRHQGGALGEVGVMCLANPAEAQRLAAFVQRVADSVTKDAGCFVAAMKREQEADAAEDIAQTDVLLNPTPENLREYIEKCDAAIARLREARDAAQRELER